MVDQLLLIEIETIFRRLSMHKFSRGIDTCSIFDCRMANKSRLVFVLLHRVRPTVSVRFV